MADLVRTPLDHAINLSDAYSLYQEVKEIIVLAECTNGDNKYLISSVNELRNAFDHIMRSVNDSANIATHLDKAKGHIYRAGYDAYEIIVISKMNEIMDIRTRYSYDAIIEAYPDYLSRIIPTTEKARLELIKAKSNKSPVKDSASENSCYAQFESIAIELIAIAEDITLHIPGIVLAEQNIKEKEAARQTKEQKNNRTMGLIYPVIVGVLLLIITILLTKITTKDTEVPQAKTTDSTATSKIDTSKTKPKQTTDKNSQ